jgi:hypothetical protein
MALIPREFRRQVTRKIEDPEPGRIVVDARRHDAAGLRVLDLARDLTPELRGISAMLVRVRK